MHLGCVFEDILNVIRMGKAKNKGGGKKEEKYCQKNPHEGRLQSHEKQMIMPTCNLKFQVIVSEENCLGTEGAQVRHISCKSCSKAKVYRTARSFPFKWERGQNLQLFRGANEQ